MNRMPPTTPSVSQSVSAVTLTVSSGSPSTTVSQTFSDSATLASLQLGSNSIPITNPAIISRFATPGLQCSNTLSLAYSGLTNVSTPAAVNNFVATPIVLSNFGPSFTYSYVSGGVGTFTLPQPSSNGSSPGAFSYSVVGSAGVVSVSGNVVTILAAGTTTIRATQAAAGGYASAYVEASVTINPIAPTFSNNGVFTISSKNFGDAAFTPAYPTSNSSGAFTYTSSNTSFATVNPITGLVTIVAAGTTTIRATQAAAGGYTSAYVEASVTINPIAPTFSNSGVFTISSKNFGDAPFTPSYPTSNSSGAFTYTSSNTSFATVNPTTGVVTIPSDISVNALNFDGNNDYVNLGIPTLMQTTQLRQTMTIECLFKTSDTAAQKGLGCLITQWIGGSNSDMFTLFMASTGEINIWVVNANGLFSGCGTTSTYKDAKWHHVCMNQYFG